MVYLVTRVFIMKCKLPRSGSMVKKKTLYRVQVQPKVGVRMDSERGTIGTAVTQHPEAHGGHQASWVGPDPASPPSKGSRPVSRRESSSIGLFHSDRAGPGAGQANIKSHSSPVRRGCRGRSCSCLQGLRRSDCFLLGGAACSRALCCAQEGKGQS